MTKRYPGGYITKTAPTVSTTSAPGIWTMEQQAAYQKAGTWPFGGPFNYIEDVFSTWLYNGAGAAVSINNGIDFAGKGGMVWFKDRARSGGTTVYGAGCHLLYDTNRGVNSAVSSNLTDAANTASGHLTAFNSNGFSLAGNWEPNTYQSPLVSWSFRKQPKFFDVVTYTGDGSYPSIPHNLGSVPGCIIVKRLDDSSEWTVYHRSTGAGAYTQLQSTASVTNNGDYFPILPTATDFSVGPPQSVNGAKYVAYLFAHNAGGFGLTGTDNVISCGSYTGTGAAGNNITLGYEPQWLLVKKVSDTGQWYMLDNMRGMPTGSNVAQLIANLSNAETSGDLGICPTATGFSVQSTGSGYNQSGATFIYIAIRRGPMKTPTSGTSVFTPVAYTGDGTASRAIFSGGFNPDMVFLRERGAVNYLAPIAQDRLRGTPWLYTPFTDPEADYGAAVAVGFNSKSNTLTSGTTAGTDTNRTSITYSMETFARAPSFFDVVCTTANGSANQRVAHNLGVAPELIITKVKTGLYQEWRCYSATLGRNYYIVLNTTDAAIADTNAWGTSNPTATDFGVRSGVWDSGYNYVAYLFASCPGVSKVGSYTGTGGTQTINCGFAARYVLIKRTDSIGDWWNWDTARGMVSGTDPRLALNSGSGETNTNWVYTDAAGFQIVTTDATVNASGGSYIYLAIA